MSKDNEKDIEMVVAGLVLDPASNAPIVILKDPEGDRCLPIWIGLSEATAIASALKKVQLARPMTHDLMRSMIEDLGGQVVRVVVTNLQDNTFHANIELKQGDALIVIDARPSDAIAIAVRVSAPISVSKQVLEHAQVTLVAVAPEGAEEMDIDQELLESQEQNFANIDKEKWAEILADMDPDDFKYKM